MQLNIHVQQLSALVGNNFTNIFDQHKQRWYIITVCHMQSYTPFPRQSTGKKKQDFRFPNGKPIICIEKSTLNYEHLLSNRMFLFTLLVVTYEMAANLCIWRWELIYLTFLCRNLVSHQRRQHWWCLSELQLFILWACQKNKQTKKHQLSSIFYFQLY